MKINLENLFYMVYEHFGNVAEYHKIRLECWEKQNGHLRKIGMKPQNYSLYVEYLDGKDAYRFSKAWERSECMERNISEFCAILGIDMRKLYGLVRGIIKWHEKREWQLCFPFTDKNNDVILSYLSAE
jgi:hypothetical protein